MGNKIEQKHIGDVLHVVWTAISVMLDAKNAPESLPAYLVFISLSDCINNTFRVITCL